MIMVTVSPSLPIHGRWTLESRDNVDAFLACRGVSWLLRTTMMAVKADLEFVAPDGADCEKDQLVKRTHSRLGLRTETLPCPGVYEPARTLSGKPEVGTLFFEDAALVQEMALRDTNEVIARVERKVVDDKLHVTMKCGNVVAREVYARVDV